MLLFYIWCIVYVSGQKIREIVSQEAERAISERGHFALAIPGGSILKMLAGDIANKEKWTSKTTLVYVNHKCVSMEDGESATHAKATKLFLDGWDGVNVIVMNGSADGEKEAKDYEDQIKMLDEDILPIDSDTGLPVFDLSLIGVGGE
jgi:6-phosphogluconolactonase